MGNLLQVPDGIGTLSLSFLPKGSLDQSTATIKQDGYVGMIGCPGMLTFTLTTETRDIVPFVVDGQKKVTRKKRDDDGSYSIRIQVKEGNSAANRGVFHTEYPNNNIRLLVFEPGTARFSVWEVGVVSQRSAFFVTSQRTYEAECFTDGEDLTVPFFEDQGWHRWPEVAALVKEVVGDLRVVLRSVEEYETPFSQEPDPAALEPGTARVVWFSAILGVGFVMTREGKARVHWTQVPIRGRRRFLDAGETVRYAELCVPHETKTKTTTFPQEIRGVELV